MNKTKSRAFFSKGNGELIAGLIITVALMFVIIMLAAIVQLTSSLNEIEKIATVSSRAAAVCTSLSDANRQAQLVAESACTNPNIEDVQAFVEYAGEDAVWGPGTYVTVTINADVNTIDPFVTSGTRSKSILVTVENADSH